MGAGIQWRKEGWGDHNPVTKTFKRMWIILEPVIFALIGTEIQVDKINPETLGLSIVVLLLALAVRMVGTYFAVCGGDLTRKEKIFMAFAWLPKATVQAALGPIFLDNVLKQKEDQYASSKDRFRRELDGIQCEVQATDASEIGIDNIRDKA